MDCSGTRRYECCFIIYPEDLGCFISVSVQRYDIVVMKVSYCESGLMRIPYYTIRQFLRIVLYTTCILIVVVNVNACREPLIVIHPFCPVSGSPPVPLLLFSFNSSLLFSLH